MLQLRAFWYPSDLRSRARAIKVAESPSLFLDSGGLQLFILASGLDPSCIFVLRPGCGSSKDFLDHAAKGRRCLPHSRIVSVLENARLSMPIHRLQPQRELLAPAACMRQPGCFGSREFPLIKPHRYLRHRFEGSHGRCPASWFDISAAFPRIQT